MKASAASKFGGLECFSAFRFVCGAWLFAVSSQFCWAQVTSDDPWAKLQNSPSMTCLDNEAELNRIWVEGGELYWDAYGNVSQVCKILNSAEEDGAECLVKKRDSGNEWYFKIAAADSGVGIVAENFFNFDLGQWDAIISINGISDRATLPCW
jgi:hypothetical protein